MKNVKLRFAVSVMVVLVVLVGLIVASASTATAKRPKITLSGYCTSRTWPSPAPPTPLTPALPSFNVTVSTSPALVIHNVRNGRGTQYIGGIESKSVGSGSHADVIRNYSWPGVESIWHNYYYITDVTVTDAATGESRRGDLVALNQGHSGGDPSGGVTHGLSESTIISGTGGLKGAKGFMIAANGVTGIGGAGSSSYFNYYYEISVPAREAHDD